MKIKRFIAKNMRQAIQKVREEFGSDAVILSNNAAVGGGVELVAALDFDETQIHQKFQSSSNQAHLPASKTSQNANDMVTWSSDATLENMQSEINGLRSLLEDQLAGLAWHENQRTNSIQTALLKRLLELGVTNALCRELVDKVSVDNLTQGWTQVTNAFTHRLSIAQDDVFNQGGIIAFVGPTGVGKTTTIAKLAARYSIQYGTRNIGLVTTDNYRIAAHEQLASYGNIIDVTVHQANGSQSLREVLHHLRHKELVLIDNAGMSQRDARLTEQLSELSQASKDLKLMLVLPATSQYSFANEVVKNFLQQATVGCIITKLDEASHLGEVLSSLIQHKLPIVYTTDGQSVPEDIHNANARDLVKRMILLGNNHQQPIADKALAYAFGDLANANE